MAKIQPVRVIGATYHFWNLTPDQLDDASDYTISKPADQGSRAQVREGPGARLITGFAGDQSRKPYLCSSVYTHTPSAFKPERTTGSFNSL